MWNVIKRKRGCQIQKPMYMVLWRCHMFLQTRVTWWFVEVSTARVVPSFLSLFSTFFSLYSLDTRWGIRVAHVLKLSSFFTFLHINKALVSYIFVFVYVSIRTQLLSCFDSIIWYQSIRKQILYFCLLFTH